MRGQAELSQTLVGLLLLLDAGSEASDVWVCEKLNRIEGIPLTKLLEVLGVPPNRQALRVADIALAGPKYLREQVEKGALACTVLANDGDAVACADAKIKFWAEKPWCFSVPTEIDVVNGDAGLILVRHQWQEVKLDGVRLWWPGLLDLLLVHLPGLGAAGLVALNHKFFELFLPLLQALSMLFLEHCVTTSILEKLVVLQVYHVSANAVQKICIVGDHK
mmetsp:Transcript_56769/g.143931  ORF Transcript_56769/g.143931 Transcript_56769/m.143931 type:complete len:220 (-) Transcript_56769:1081-1740(-)